MNIKDIKIGQFVRCPMYYYCEENVGQFKYYRGFVKHIDYTKNLITISCISERDARCYSNNIVKDYYGHLCYELKDIYNKYVVNDSPPYSLEMNNETLQFLLSDMIELWVCSFQTAKDFENKKEIPILFYLDRTSLGNGVVFPILYLNISINNTLPLGKVEIKGQ